jgi:tRNA nucleotidyltransferase (CCA-adding enzyme)
MKLTPEAERAIGAIVAVGGRPLLVGGFVRDHLLGIESKDIDIEVHGPVTVEAVASALRKVGKVDEVGKSFGVLKLGGLDISFPRRDRQIGSGHTGFVIEVDHDMTVEEALVRRDFTINSMAYDPIRKTLIDPFYGQLAIDVKSIVATSPEHFAEDPLRVLRAVQFASRFGFKIADETAELCAGLVTRMTLEISAERFWMEWYKILTKGSLEAAYRALQQIGATDVFPGLTLAYCRIADARIDGVKFESPEHRASVLLAAQFAGAEREAAQQFLHSIDAPGWLRKAVLRLMSPYTGQGHTLEAQARRIARKVRMRDWLTVQGYTDCPIYTAAWVEDVLDAPHPRLLTGDHLKALGWTPGPIFAEILTTAEFFQDQYGWETETEALAWLAKNYPEAS